MTAAWTIFIRTSYELKEIKLTTDIRFKENKGIGWSTEGKVCAEPDNCLRK
jgi:hypothetical protein